MTLDNWRLCFPKMFTKVFFYFYLKIRTEFLSFLICVGTPLTFTVMFQKVQSFSSAYLEKQKHKCICVVEINRSV